MRVSKEWLQTFIDVDASIDALSENITRSGIEVDAVINYADGIRGVVTGYVTDAAPHPEADKLIVCQVDIGSEVTQIVCGAKNVRKDTYVVVVTPGGTLPGGIEITKTELRGEASNGMICSLQELGIPTDYVPEEYKAGIFMFESPVPVGEDALKFLYLDDYVMEFDLTPNRKDALSMIGAAHETRAIFGGDVTAPTYGVTEEPGTQSLTIKTDNDTACPYYAARLVTGIHVRPSPLYMQMRLIKAGIRPINNVVDISNYVLLEFGQPLHMFDRDRIGSDTIVTRYANEGEKMTTLDDKTRTLTASDIVVTNGEEPIALAGVMGGDFSEVNSDTVNVVIESAVFDPVSIRKTSQRLAIRSEASLRFEKGVSHTFVDKALDRAAYLLSEHAYGTVVQGIVSDGALDVSDKQISTTLAFINNRLGMKLSEDDIAKSLERLGLTVTITDGDIEIRVPSRRDDLKIPEDITEEVARIYGYDRLESTLPEYTTITAGQLTDEQQKTRTVKRLLESIGFNQAINYALTSEKESQYFNNRGDALRLLMPISEEREVLRNSLVPHLIKNVTYNRNRQEHDVMFYEIGNVFESRGQERQPKEIEMLAGVIHGHVNSTEWVGHGFQGDFYAAKGVVEAVVEKLGLTNKVTYAQETLYDELHPGRTCAVYLKDAQIGYIGEVHPQFAEDNDLSTTVVFELELAPLVRETTGTIEYEKLPKFPTVSRDLALVVDTDMNASEIESIIREHGNEWLKRIYVFDVYEGERMERGKKSVAVRITYLNREKTMTDEEIDALQLPILDGLADSGIHLRG